MCSYYNYIFQVIAVRTDECIFYFAYFMPYHCPVGHMNYLIFASSLIKMPVVQSNVVVDKCSIKSKNSTM